MNPIAQTFIVSEPENGVDAVFVTAVDLFFRKKSSNYGIELQIRETQNGVPTKRVIPYASKILQPSDINISGTAATATKFTFDTPVVLRTNVQYAITVSPVGGDPDYDIWIAELGANDVANPTVPIYKNNQLGSLFVSSNDLNFIQRPTENIKYTLYTAQFSQTSGNAVFRNANNDFFRVRDTIGTFRPGEQIMVSNGWLELAALNLSGANVFTIGETLYQTSSGSSPNTATGKVYFANTTVVKVSNLNGAFVSTGNTTVVGATSSKTSVITAAYQNVITTSATNVITVPDPSYSEFANGNYIAVFTASTANAQILQITANSTVSRTLTLSANVNFTDSAARITAVYANANLHGYLASQTRSYPESTFVIGGVNSNTTVNFANTSGKQLIGRDSGASAYIISLVDMYFDSVTSQFTEAKPRFTDTNWAFQGISNTKSVDASYNTVRQDVPYEFNDQQRMLMSRSNELKASLAVGGTSGASSFKIRSDLTTANNKSSPYIDTIRNQAVFTHNMIFPEVFLNGTALNIANLTGYFALGDTVWQANDTTNTTGTVVMSNSTFIAVSNLASSNTSHIAGFNVDSNITSTNITANGVANVSAIRVYNEASFPAADQSRYISKNVVLADKQDSEDLICYLTAYRPQETNLLVYGQFSSADDAESLGSKHWSRLQENTISVGLYSSLVNRDDYVDLAYDLPTSIQLQNNNVSTNTTSATVNFVGTADNSGIKPGNFVYIRDLSYGVTGVSISAAGSGYATGDQVRIDGGVPGILNANAVLSVVANATGNVVGLSVISKGSYPNNQVLSANATANVTGSGTGLTLGVSALQFEQSTKFNVRKVISTPNTSSIVLNSNNSFSTGNSTVGAGAIGLIPDLETQYGAFKYANNEGIIRYTTSTDQVFDSYKTFAVKIVLVSNNSYIVPRLNDMRAIALQV